jgi:trigger factor
MNITVDKRPNCLATIKVNVPAETRRDLHQKALTAIARQVQIPGFRKGKTPASIVEKKFGNHIQEDVEERIRDQAMEKLATEQNVRVLYITKTDKADPLTFNFDVITFPDVNLPDYKGLPIKVRDYQATDADVDRVIQQRRKMAATYQAVERAAQADDLLKISYTGTADGQPLSELLKEELSYVAESPDYAVDLGTETFIPEFGPALIGAKVGETREVAVDFSKAQIEELKDKSVSYAVTVKGIEEPILPELNDEFIKTLGVADTVAETREKMLDYFKGQAEAKSQTQKRIASMTVLRDRVTMELPDVVVEQAMRNRANELFRMNLQRGMDQHEVLERLGEIREAALAQAMIDVKDEFILMAIVQKENIQVTPDEIVGRVESMARSQRISFDEAFKQVNKSQNGIQSIRDSVAMAKALDVLVADAVVEIDPNAEETPTE